MQFSALDALSRVTGGNPFCDSVEHCKCTFCRHPGSATPNIKRQARWTLCLRTGERSPNVTMWHDRMMDEGCDNIAVQEQWEPGWVEGLGVCLMINLIGLSRTRGFRVSVLERRF